MEVLDTKSALSNSSPAPLIGLGLVIAVLITIWIEFRGDNELNAAGLIQGVSMRSL